LYFLGELRKLLKESGTRCLAWALMSTHFHLLLKTGKRPLAWLMHRLLLRYSLHYNHRYQRPGHLFQNRYKSILCEEEPYLMELVRYIHLNPVRTGSIQTMTDLAGYPWSGHGVLLGKVKMEWQEVDEVLGLFGRSRGKARDAYESFVRKGMDMGHREDLAGGGMIRSVGGREGVERVMKAREKVQGDDRILGSGEYVAEVLREVEHRDRRKEGLKRRLKPEQVIESAAEAMGVSLAEVKARSRMRRVTEARSLACKWLVEDLGVRVIDVARLLGVTPSAVISGIKRGREVEKRDDAKLRVS
jgi:REP element-mobilizing transposase RayT